MSRHEIFDRIFEILYEGGLVMKANEASEKLYIALNELTEDERTFVLDHRVDYPICTEYTRTDAFIKKACEFIAQNMKCSGYTIQTKAKFIKEFKNYMKGK